MSKAIQKRMTAARKRRPATKIVIDEANGLVFSSEEDLYRHFNTEIDELEKEFFRLRRRNDIPEGKFSDFESNLTTLLEDGVSANVVIGPHVEVDTRSTLIYSDSGRIIATIGLEGFLVVDTGDALLIAPRDRAQDVKKIVDQLRQEGRNDVL